MTPLTIILLCLFAASLWILHYVYKTNVETFIDNSGSNVPLSKKDLLIKAIDLIRTEITTLQSLNSHDAVVLARIQNMIALRNKLQRMYADLLAGIISEDDVEFTEADLADFLAGTIPNESQGFNSTAFVELSRTLRALHDSSIYWNMEIGIQNYNPRPAPIQRYQFPTSSYTADVTTQETIASRGGNGAAVGPNISLSEPGAAPENSWFSFGYDVKTSPAEIDRFDYKHRLRRTCDAIRSGQLGDAEVDFGCPGPDVSKDFDYEGRYKLVCERLGYTWGAGYQQMLGCPGNN